MGKSSSKRAVKQEKIKKQIIEFYKSQVKQNRDLPPYYDMEQETGIPASTLRRYLYKLEEEGIVKLSWNKHRINRQEIIKKQIVDFCKKQIEENGYPPSNADIVQGTGIPRMTVQRCLYKLEEEGVIKFRRNKQGRVMNRTMTFIGNGIQGSEGIVRQESEIENEKEDAGGL